MSNPFFSIIIPIYNSEAYLRECLESILNQSFSNWEAILVDDGSGDSSLNICREYRAKDKRFRIYAQPHIGPLNARLIGVNEAEGDYYLEVNSDDYIHVNCLERVHEALTDYNCDVVAWDIKCFGASEKVISYTDGVDSVLDREQFLDLIVSTANHSLCNKAIPMNYLRKIDYKMLSKDICSASDYALCGTSLVFANNIYIVPETLYFYRKNTSSITYKNSLRAVYDLIRVSEFVVCAYRKYEISNKDLESKEAIVLLSVIYERLWNSFLSDGVDLKYAKLIHSNAYYVDLKKYERLEYINWFQCVVLKAFRHGYYSFLKVLAGIKKSEHSREEFAKS